MILGVVIAVFVTFSHPVECFCWPGGRTPGLVHSAMRAAAGGKKEIKIPRSLKKPDGTIQEALVTHNFAGESEFRSFTKRIGCVVNENGTVVSNYNDLLNGTTYSVTTETPASTIHDTVLNLLGNSVTMARSAELQVPLLRVVSPIDSVYFQFCWFYR